jgi:hypothetical protein
MDPIISDKTLNHNNKFMNRDISQHIYEDISHQVKSRDSYRTTYRAFRKDGSFFQSITTSILGGDWITDDKLEGKFVIDIPNNKIVIELKVSGESCGYMLNYQNDKEISRKIEFPIKLDRDQNVISIDNRKFD